MWTKPKLKRGNSNEQIKSTLIELARVTVFGARKLLPRVTSQLISVLPVSRESHPRPAKIKKTKTRSEKGGSEEQTKISS